MLLVPRQLLRSGMTGSVPYYGGRFTPGQAYAASHPSARPADRPVPSRSPVEAPLRPHREPSLPRPRTPIRRQRSGTCAIPGCSPARSTTTC